MNDRSNSESLMEGSLISHLLELRDRLLRAVLCVVIVFLPCASFQNDLFTLIAQPLIEKLPKGTSMISTSLTAPLMAPLKLAALVALFISMPYVLYQIWAFVSPGLYKHEKRFAVPLLVSSVLLFYCGAAFAYFAVFPVMFGFLTTAVPTGIVMMPDMTLYMDFAAMLIFAFGAAFEIPIATFLLVWTGLVKLRQLTQNRGYVLIVVFIIAAILTPTTDPLSQSMMAGPMYLLYELGIIFSRIFLKDKIAQQEKEAAEEAASGD
ncbi:MAG: twin-arginine translocase subunit TatC [Steroidobacteraceae bacterium]